MSNEDEEYLKQLDGVHRPEEVPDQTFENYPDGKYKARLDKIYISKSKSNDRTQCVMEFEIIEGTYAFRKAWKFSGMMTTDQLDWLTNDLRRLGITQFTWSTLPSKFQDILDNLYILELKTKKGYQNVYITKKLSSEDMASSTVSGDDDVPF